MSELASDGPIWVLSVEAVRRAFDTLMSTKVHPFFPAYLQIRRDAMAADVTEDIRPNWNEMGALLRVPDAPEKFPYLRPFKDHEGPRWAWLNRNLAGSWAPSSVREDQAPARVLERGSVRGSWSLRPNHAVLALEHLLYGAPLDGFAVAAFLYRDYGFLAGDSGDPPDITNVYNGFARDFRFLRDRGGAHQDLVTLFALESQGEYSYALDLADPAEFGANL